MKVFVSFSGTRSQLIASALRDWIPKVLQAVEPWMSEEDIEKGRRWDSEISDVLEETDFGIVCLTPENLTSPWIHFEAGALAKSVDNSYIWTLLTNLKPSDVPDPLGRFQHTVADEVDVRRLLGTMNGVVASQGSRGLSEDELDETFQLWWPKLAESIEALPEQTEEPPFRNDRELLEEVLVIVREIARMRDQQASDVLNEAKAFAIRTAQREAIKQAEDPRRLAKMLRRQ